MQCLDRIGPTSWYHVARATPAGPSGVDSETSLPQAVRTSTRPRLGNTDDVRMASPGAASAVPSPSRAGAWWIPAWRRDSPHGAVRRGERSPQRHGRPTPAPRSVAGPGLTHAGAAALVDDPAARVELLDLAQRRRLPGGEAVHAQRGGRHIGDR